ncbi:hypothetical protein M4951_21685 [Blastopirellula sp. J2-11]|uniref:hypothetical protein n=1 Tax=Blastopirellula sp. J2-11 TaxID=2943192 RepID=UPI0021C7E5C7|nr:hypothetical protein [Blastopirellula sp. J2-11]UUO05966.1 hypothetical protein M4951_21685 [Blastopirellula sp. J2-11]
MKKIPIVSREYKVMLEPKKFVDLDEAVTQFWVDLCFFAHGNSRDAVQTASLQLTEEREIVFLDSPDHELRLLHGHVLRRRQTCGGKTAEYTLKMRDVDRYVASGADVAAAKKVKHKQKLEEDLLLLSSDHSRSLIQHSRFSHSGVAIVKSSRDTPADVSGAARLFPGLKQLPWSEKKRKQIPLCVVNDFRPHERVYRGAEFIFGDKKGERVQAEVAVILWTAGRAGEVIAAEFSFRYGDRRERYPAAAAEMAKDFFEATAQLSAWVRPAAPTKTAIAYGASDK